MSTLATVTESKKENKKSQSFDQAPGTAFTPLIEIGAPGDPFEKAADKKAAEVVMSPSPARPEARMNPAASGPAVQMKPSHGNQIQMKCKECEEEEKEEMAGGAMIQRKMMAGSPPEDEGTGQLQMKPLIQRKENEKSYASSDISKEINKEKSSGEPLPERTSDEMEGQMGADFSNVKVHRDNKAAELNSNLGARAFTHGNNVFFNKGEFNPESREGKQLLAHELTHTIQQGASPERKGETPPPGRTDAEPQPRNEGEVVVAGNEKEIPPGEKQSPGEGTVHEKKQKSIAKTEISTGFENMKPGDSPLAKKLNAINPEKEVQVPDKAAQMMEQTLPGKEGQTEKAVQKEGEEAVENAPEVKALEAADEANKEEEGGEEKPQGIDAEKEEAIAGATLSSEMLMASTEKAAGLLSSKIFFNKKEIKPQAPQQPQPGSRTGAQPAGKQKVPDSAELEQQRFMASNMANGFVQQGYGKIQSVLATGQTVRPRLQASGDAAKAGIVTAAADQQALVSEQIKTLKGKARSKANATIGSISAQYKSTVSSVTKATETSRKKLKSEYDTALKNINKYQQDQLPKIDKAYTDGAEKFKAAGVKVGDKAKQTQDKRAASLMVGYRNVDDSLLDGPYTYNKQKAKSNAAKEVGKGYQKGIKEEGDKQAKKLLEGEGKANDIKNVRNEADKARETLKKHYEASIKSLDAGEKQALDQAEKTKTSLTNTANKSLRATIDALDKQQEAQQRMLTEFGDRQQKAVDRDTFKAIASLEQGNAEAVSKLADALQMFRDQTHASETPDLALLGQVIASSTSEIDTSVNNVLQTNEAGLAASEAGLLAGGTQAAEGLAAMAQQGITEATSITDGLMPVMDKLKKGAATAFSKIDKTHSDTNSKTTEAASAGIKAIDEGTKKLFEQMDKNLQKGLTDSAKKVEESFQAAVDKDMLNKSIEEENKAAAEVKPRWKKVLKVLLIIVVIVVVALVIGPAVIGFVAGAAASVVGAGAAATAIGAIVGGAIVGAAAGAVIQMGSNIIDGKPVMDGVGKAIVVGAIGGALGGAGGALGQVITKGASGLVPALSRFGTDMAFDVAGGILGDLAVGNPITLEGIVYGAAMGAGVSVSMGGLSALKGTKLDVGGFATKTTDIQTKFQTKGEAFGTKVGEGIKAKVGGGAKPEVDVTALKVETPEPPKIETPEPPKVESPVAPKAEAPAPKTEPGAPSPKAETPSAPKTEPAPVPKTEPTPAPKAETPTPKKPTVPEAPKVETPAAPKTEPAAPKAETPSTKVEPDSPHHPKEMVTAKEKDLGTHGGKKVEAEFKKSDGHTKKVLDDGECVTCTICKEVKSKYETELNEKPKLKSELEEIEAKLDKQGDSPDPELVARHNQIEAELKTTRSNARKESYTTKRQKDFQKEIDNKVAKGEIDENMAHDLIEYNAKNPHGTRDVDNAIGQFKSGKKLSEDGLFTSPEGKPEIDFTAKPKQDEFGFGKKTSEANLRTKHKQQEVKVEHVELTPKQQKKLQIQEELRTRAQKEKRAIEKEYEDGTKTGRPEDDARWKDAHKRMIEASESLGEIATNASVNKHLPGAKPLKSETPGKAKTGEFDRVYDQNGELYIFEAKGAGAGRGSREVGGGLRAEQGTPQYRDNIIDNMEKQALASGDAELLNTVMKLKSARASGKLHYMQVTQKVDVNGNVTPEVTLIKFD